MILVTHDMNLARDVSDRILPHIKCHRGRDATGTLRGTAVRTFETVFMRVFHNSGQSTNFEESKMKKVLFGLAALAVMASQRWLIKYVGTEGAYSSI